MISKGWRFNLDISIEEAKKALALNSGPESLAHNLAYSYFLQGRKNEAHEVIQTASARETRGRLNRHDLHQELADGDNER